MIKVTNLSKEFKTNKKYPGFKGAIKSFFSREYTVNRAVDAISFTIEEGEMVGYIGANGAGKSTTIKMMTGILTPSGGSVEVNGIKPYENRELHAKDIGVVFGQRTQLWWDLPLSESFALLRDIYGVSQADYESRMKFLQEVLDLEPFMLSSVRTLSLGQRMRADIAAALLHNPKILYLDEPTIGLDVMVKENVRKAIKEINRVYGTTVILTTHDLNDIEELCSRIIIIDQGVILYDGSLDAIKQQYGYMTRIEIQTKREVLVEALPFVPLFDLGQDDYRVEQQGTNLAVTFNRHKLGVSDILFHLMKDYRVLDFKVSETSIEDIIKKIYRKEVIHDALT
ncbi:MAG: ABC transporter ATP-binding protein [Erysipelotrichaceae bacterium]